MSWITLALIVAQCGVALSIGAGGTSSSSTVKPGKVVARVPVLAGGMGRATDLKRVHDEELGGIRDELKSCRNALKTSQEEAKKYYDAKEKAQMDLRDWKNLAPPGMDDMKKLTDITQMYNALVEKTRSDKYVVMKLNTHIKKLENENSYLLEWQSDNMERRVISPTVTRMVAKLMPFWDSYTAEGLSKEQAQSSILVFNPATHRKLTWTSHMPNIASFDSNGRTIGVLGHLLENNGQYPKNYQDEATLDLWLAMYRFSGEWAESSLYVVYHTLNFPTDGSAPSYRLFSSNIIYIGEGRAETRFHNHCDDYMNEMKTNGPLSPLMAKMNESISRGGVVKSFVFPWKLYTTGSHLLESAMLKCMSDKTDKDFVANLANRNKGFNEKHWSPITREKIGCWLKHYLYVSVANTYPKPSSSANPGSSTAPPSRSTQASTSGSRARRELLELKKKDELATNSTFYTNLLSPSSTVMPQWITTFAGGFVFLVVYTALVVFTTRYMSRGCPNARGQPLFYSRSRSDARATATLIRSQ